MKLCRLIMRRRFRFLTSNRLRQSVMWTSLACAMVVAIVAFLSIWRPADCHVAGGNPELLVDVGKGVIALELAHVAHRPLAFPDDVEVAWRGSSLGPSGLLMPDWGRYRFGTRFVTYWIDIPLWLVIVVILMPGILIKYTGRPKPWQCRKCRYDLRGLEGEGDGSGDGAVCPECGDRLSRASVEP